MVDNSDVEPGDLLNVLTRDAADEIRQHEKEILGVVGHWDDARASINGSAGSRYAP